ncbi:uncharacterized protein LOC142159968 [Mixophyes fleayi]|uniref:uncharacterized protein LOC142159968 n=1 Tax=Mixophyes fleayi TaxID=3061075 RepID=UPI003F4DFECB
MEKWENVERHKNLQKDGMMEDCQATRSLDGSSNRNTPDTSGDLYSEDGAEEDHCLPKDCQGEELREVKVEVISQFDGEETFITDQWCVEEEITTDISTDICLKKNVSGRHHSTDCKMEEFHQESDMTQSVQFIVSLGGHTNRRAFNYFDSNIDLLNHRRKHKWHRPFQCSLCGKAFYRNACLVVHQRCHTGEKPFSCSECGKCYRDRSGLRRHHRFHTGEKPFSCSECGKRFTQNSSLSAHQKLAHGAV